jgi:mercuric ion binding protein
MKTMKIVPVLALSFLFASTAMAQSKTETFKVSGNCGMCKNKIEKAAKEAGAKEASWDTESKQLTVTYKTKSTNTAKIQQKIADVGYDNVGFKATTEAYDKLHGCCKYDREAGASKESCCSDGAKCSHHSEETHTAKMECCKDGKCTMAGHDGKDCCKKDGKMPARTSHSDGDCCKDGKCS